MALLSWLYSRGQGCQIFLDTKYQNGENIPNYHEMAKWYQNIPNGCNIFQMTIKCTNIFLSKALQNLPKLGFCFENIPSGNPARGDDVQVVFCLIAAFTVAIRMKGENIRNLEKNL
jgi:hypothetical protein